MKSSQNHKTDTVSSDEFVSDNEEKKEEEKKVVEDATFTMAVTGDIMCHDTMFRDAYDNSTDINVTLDEAERKILNVVNNRRTTEFRTIKDVVNSTKANLDE